MIQPPFAISCLREGEAFPIQSGTSLSFETVIIGADARLDPPFRRSSIAVPAYMGHIQWIGSTEPASGRPGLGILAGTVLYSGLEYDFVSAFAHFQIRSSHNLCAIFMEAGNVLLLEEDTVYVQGKAGMALIRSGSSAAGSVPFRVSQYCPGEKFPITSLIGESSDSL